MNKLTVVAGLAILLASVIYPMASQTASAASISWTGDQTITDAQSYSGDTITLTNGNLTIASGGALTFQGVTLIMESTVSGRYHIEVQEGGTFQLSSSSTIRSSSHTYRFQFWVRANSTFQMDNSALNDCGYSASAANSGLGLFIESNSAQVTNSTISDGYFGIVVDTGASPFIYTNTVTRNDAVGVAMTAASTPVVDNNRITGNAVSAAQPGIYNLNAAPVISNNTITGHQSAAACWAIRNTGVASQPAGSITGNTISQNSNGIYLERGNAIVSGNTISSNVFSADPTNTGYGLADSTLSSITNCFLDRNSYGVMMVGPALSSYTGCRITNNTVCGIGGDAGTAGFGGIFTNCTLSGNRKDIQFIDALAGTGGGICTLINTVYDNKSVEISDNEAQLIIKWLVHVKVTYESSGATVEGASVKCRDRQGGIQLVVVTGADGWSPWMILHEKTIGNKSEVNVTLAPYNISVAKGNAFNYTVMALDQSYEFTFPLDDLVPWLRIESPQNGDVVNRTTANFAGTVETPYVSVTVGGVPAAITAEGTWTAKVPLAVEGRNKLVASAQDRGKNFLNLTVEVVRDTVAPVLTITAPEDNSLTNRTMVTVSGKVNDVSGHTFVNGAEVPVAADGTFSTQVPVDEGPNTIRIESADAVWNTALVTVRVERDTSKPMMTVAEPADGFATNASTVTVRGTTDSDSTLTINGKPVPLSVDRFTYTASLEEGENIIVITSMDPAGNPNTEVRRVVRDSTPPKLTVTSPQDGVIVKESLLTVRGSTDEGALVKVNGGGVNYAGRNFVTEVTLTAEGENIIIIDAYDGLKNHVQVVFKVYLDTIAPDLRITSPANNYLTAASQFELRGRTEATANVTVDGEPVTVDRNGLFSVKLPLPSDGTYTFEIVSQDIAGNFNEEFLTVTRDTVARYNISSPIDGLKTKQKTLSVTGDVEPGSTVNVNGNSVSVRSDGTFIAEIILNDGQNTIIFQVRDKAGNLATKELTVTKIKPAPAPSGFIPGFEAVLVLAGVCAVAAARRAWKRS